MSQRGVSLSVVVPAHNAAAMLRQTLPALRGSDLPRAEWELIVVDDASTDDTAAVAAEHADTVLRLTGQPRGPAFARNRGVEQSSAEAVVFLDADVCVHPDTLRRLGDALAADPGLTAVFGSYDANPSAPGLTSRFRNLLHHYVHQSSPGEVETFWAGCGAMRRCAFLAVGGMNAQRYPRPQIEDIELGRRLRQRGYRIKLRADIQCTHLKRWTLGRMIVTDFPSRGVPWTLLLLEQGAGATPAKLNLRPGDKVSTVLAVVCAFALGGALSLLDARFLAIAALAAAGVYLLNLPFYRFLAAREGTWFAVRAFPLHLLFHFVSGLAAFTGIMLHLTHDAAIPERALELAFLPLHKRAFGVAAGVTMGLVVFVATLMQLARAGSDLPLALLAQYFYGYTVSLPGAFIGLGWGFVTGFVMGWFFAFCRNLAVAMAIFTARTRAELAQLRDFLDHI